MILPTGSKRSKSLRRAFTLVELILVMGIIVVVASVSAPSLSNFFHGRTLDSESRRLLSLTRYGQNRAVSEGVPMLLWIDEKEHVYGLEEESGYTDEDARSLEYIIHQDLQIEVVNADAATVANARITRVGSSPQAQSKHRSLPYIRFQPDGSVDETSLQAVRVSERNGTSVYLAQTRNRLNYELRDRYNVQEGYDR